MYPVCYLEFIVFFPQVDLASLVLQFSNMVDLNGPALTPPPGVTPILDHPPNNNSLASAINSVSLIVVTLLVLARCYLRLATRTIFIEDCEFPRAGI